MLLIEDLTYRIAGRTLLEKVSASIPSGHKVGLVGRNGAGKSTLLNLILGNLIPDGGRIQLGGRTRVGTVAQSMPEGEGTPLDFVVGSDRERAALLAEAETSTDGMRLGEIHARLDDIGASTAPARAAVILAGLGFDEARQNQPLMSFSGGWRMRVALAATLFLQPDLLLLDEPSNHLDLETRLWLEGYLQSYPGTLVLISHDRGLLNTVPGHILHLHGAKLTLYRGNYDAFERARAERANLEASVFKAQEHKRQRMQAFVDRFRYKASKARQAQSRLKALAKLDAAPPADADEAVSIDLPEPEAMPPPLLTLDGASAGYGADAVILRRLDLRLDMDDRIALLGANGNGKTTLLKLIAGAMAPLSGRRQASGKLRVGYFAQDEAEAFDPTDTPFTHLARAMPGQLPPKVRGHLGRFGFSQSRADVPIGNLSGGERAKLLLASVTRHAPHILLLDEPTNHLDIDAREALISALTLFAGAVVLVTHDPHLVELCADRLWLVDGGTCRPFDGDMDDYRRHVAESRRAARRQEGRSARGKAADAPVAPPPLRPAKKRPIASLETAAKRAETRLAKLNEERAALVAVLADPATYRGAPGALAATQAKLAAAETAIAEAESSWLEAEAALEAAASA